MFSPSFLLIVAVAALLRLFALDQIDVRYDEAVAPIFANEVAHGTFHFVVPFSGSVMRHPAVWLYVLALPYLISANFYVIAAYRVLLDVLAVGATYWLGRRYFNQRVAWLAALLFAVAPWAVHLSRKLWTAPLALWSVLALIGLLEVALRRNPKGWWLALTSTALAIGTHLAAVYVLPAVLLVAVLFRRTLCWRWVLLGLMPGVIISAAYAVYDAQHGFANIQVALSGGGKATALNAEALRFALWLSGGAHLSDLTGSAIVQWQLQPAAAYEWIDELQLLWLCVAILAALLVTSRTAASHRQNGAAFAPDIGVGVLLMWWVLPVVVQLRHPQPFQVQYVSVLYPAPFVLMAWLFDRIWQRSSRWGRAANSSYYIRLIRLILRIGSGVFVCGVVGWQMLSVFRFADFVASHDTGGYRPVAAALQAVKTASIAAKELVLVVQGIDPAVNEESAILHFLALGQPHRINEASAGLMVCVAPQCNYVLGPNGSASNDYLAPNALSYTVIDQRYRVAKAASAEALWTPRSNPMPLSPLAIWDNGIALQDYVIERHADTLRVRLLLHVLNVPPQNQDYHWYAHVLNPRGQKVAQLDGGGIHPANWRRGDTFMQWFDISIPPDQWANVHELRIGNYGYPEIKPIMTQLNDGKRQDGVTLPLP